MGYGGGEGENASMTEKYALSKAEELK